MSRDKAWALADAAKEAAYTARVAVLTQRDRSLFGQRTPVPSGAVETLYILELLAGAIQELTLPDHPLRLQDLKIGIGSGWWE